MSNFDNRMTQLITTNQQLLSDLLLVLNQLKDSQYKMPLSVFEGVSIGQHVRHIIEFYQCVIRYNQDDIIDYDSRKRDLEIEQNLYYSRLQCEKLIEELVDFKPITFYKVVVNLPNDSHCVIETTFDRELAYLLEHTIHHFAIIKIGISNHFSHVIFPAGFGLAYSTQKHLALQKVEIE